jgi:hypothetical protein
MLSLFRPDKVMKRGTEIDLQIPDYHRTNGDNFIPFPVKTGQFGVTNYKGVVGKGPGLIKLNKGLPVPGNKRMGRRKPGSGLEKIHYQLTGYIWPSTP